MINKASLWGWIVSILSSAEKPKTNGASILALFGSKLLSSVDSQATDITLEGQELVLPGATKMTLIVPRGGLEEESLRGSELVCLTWPLEWCSVALTSLLGPAGPNDPKDFCNLPWCAPDPDDIGNKGFDCVLRGFRPSYLAI